MKRTEGNPSSRITELFGFPTSDQSVEWPTVVSRQACPFTESRCVKTRKSQPEVAIGTCTVVPGRSSTTSLVICPNRLLARQQIFLDCVELMGPRKRGDELVLIPEVGIPGGSVDFMLTRLRGGRPIDFVGIELQSLDTTGSIWPERQALLQALGAANPTPGVGDRKAFGINWKMTAKTILVQVHHKVQTFEHLGKHLVLVVQDALMDYIAREFKTDHLASPGEANHAMQFHAYSLVDGRDGQLDLKLAKTFSTDGDGVATCLGLQAESRVSLSAIEGALSARMGSARPLGADVAWPRQ